MKLGDQTVHGHCKRTFCNKKQLRMRLDSHWTDSHIGTGPITYSELSLNRTDHVATMVKARYINRRDHVAIMVKTW